MKNFKKVMILTLMLGFAATLQIAAQNVQSSRKYRVTAYKNGNPAITSMSNTVEVIPYMSIYIPNSFTPNGDGLNDMFGAYGEAILEFNMQVFNRWGQLVFEASHFDTKWDGTFEGTKVPQGSYIYKLSAKGITGNTARKDGTVTVVY